LVNIVEEINLMKPTKPLFSVLIANYNNGKYLEECLSSIMAQTCSNWEIVLVDDASTDDSKNIYRKFAADKRIKIITNVKNKGCGYTKRKCVEIAQGDICGFVDADDAIVEDALELLIRYHGENPDVSIVYSTHYICDENLKPQKVADYVGKIPCGVKSWSIARPVISHFASFKRSKYLATKGISPIYHKAVDKDLYYKLEYTGPVLFINKPLYYYRHHLNSISLNQNAFVAYQYELLAKAMVILRNNISKSVLKQTPYSDSELTKGILRVALRQSKDGHLYLAFKLILQSLYFGPITSMKLMLKAFIDTI